MFDPVTSPCATDWESLVGAAAGTVGRDEGPALGLLAVSLGSDMVYATKSSVINAELALVEGRGGRAGWRQPWLRLLSPPVSLRST